MAKLKPVTISHEEYADPDLQIKPCEADGCTATHERRNMFSFIVSLSHYHLEKALLSSCQCASEQHWCCSHDHAINAARKCIDEHHSADLLKPAPFATCRLPQGTTCAICESPLTTEAFHLAVCYATPGHGFAAYACGKHIAMPDGKTHWIPEQHWCCSEEHAREAAHACIEEHLDYGLRGCCNDPEHEHSHPDPDRWHAMYEERHRRKAVALCTYSTEAPQESEEANADINPA
jgi:hypothetical protein